MREIKFRAWDKTTLKGLKPLVGKVEKIDFRNQKCDLWFGSHGHIGVRFDDIELMQYTGLKDKNGKEIYEGDIVKTDEAGWVAQVIYYRDGFICTGLDRKGFSCQCNWENFEVIGNIYENPELMKEA